MSATTSHNLKQLSRQRSGIKGNFKINTFRELNVSDLKAKLIDSRIKDHIICFLFYGSMRNKKDSHKLSDYDFHLVLDRIDENILSSLRNILKGFENFDISIHEYSEIISEDGELSFQNGTQGQYFVHVLAQAETIIGTNIYADLVSKLDDKDIKNSLRFKAREYLWKIRRMVLEEVNQIYFRKYSIRLIKDILVFNECISYTSINTITNDEVLKIFADEFKNMFGSDEILDVLSLSSFATGTLNYYGIACTLAKLSNFML